MNISINSKLIFYDLNFLFSKNVKRKKQVYSKYFEARFIYEDNYEKNLNSILKFTDDNSNNLILISRPYLIDKKFFKKNNLTYFELDNGFILSNINYPLNASINEKKLFLDKNSIKYIIFEKDISNNFHKINLSHYQKKNFVVSIAQKLFYSDLLDAVNKLEKIIIEENKFFIIWKII